MGPTDDVNQLEHRQTPLAAVHGIRADPAQVEAAMAAAAEEKAMSFKAVMRIYWRAALWSCTFSLALVMEGYDLGIINSFWGQTSFLNRFGSLDANGKRFIPADWQSAVNNAASIGQVIGLVINGYAQPRFGAKRVYCTAMVAMTAAIFIPVFSTSLPMLFAGELVCGIPWGIFQTLSTAYAAEVCPLALRGYLTSFVNMAWGFGLFLAAGVVRASIVVDSEWGWRLPYMLQWVWPVPLAIAALFGPESPWWLVRRGRIDDARKQLVRLAVPGHYDEQKLDQQIALMVHTNEMEKAEVAGTGFSDCFKGTNRRRTEIICAVFAMQQTCGNVIGNYATSFLQTAGMSEAAAFDVNLALNSMYIIGTVTCWAFLYRFGRRSVYIAGQAGMGMLLGIIGILGFFPSNLNAAYGIGVLMILLNFFYNISVGPLCYTIIAELPSTRVRPQSIVLSRITYIVVGIITQQIAPRQLSAQAWNWGGRAGLFWLGCNLIAIVYCYFRLPESKGRTYGELDVLFANKVSARKFASTQVDELMAEFGAGRENATTEAVGAGVTRGTEKDELEVSHIEK